MPLACRAVSHATKMLVYAMQDTVDHNTLFNSNAALQVQKVQAKQHQASSSWILMSMAGV